MQSVHMDSDWAAEHIQVIRTLMERSAIYRRALAPIMFMLGVLGMVAAFAGWVFGVASTQGFGWYWMAVSAVGVSGAYLMVRRQALRDGEAFWSPPTRRVTQAVLPPVFMGFAVSMLLTAASKANAPDLCWLPPIWMALYGCAIHAAGFFMPRGIKLFGWVFILSSCAVGVALASSIVPHSAGCGHLLMGAFFGGLHLFYGVYLYFTEARKNEA
ncbi:MAG: hypothetical protein HY735_10360 [Verrucomicrobia bacterium]|nr:hypothetical protein [Verrucomicrobiota bacterium]